MTKESRNAAARAAYHKDVEKSRTSKREAMARSKEDGTWGEYLIRYRYGITKEQFAEMVDSQANKCAICSNEFGESRYTKPYVDHDHETGKVRALLCQKCNLAIGHFKDSLVLVEKAAEYLKRFS